MTEPKYDEDIVNLGYLKKVVAQTEEDLALPDNISRHYGSRPQPPYYKGDTWVDGNIIYTCINTRLVGTYSNADWVTESGAKEEAERKNKVFLTQPSNYRPGDMWILQTDNDHRAGKKGEMLIATTGRTTYDSDDWVSMLGYGTIRSINQVSERLNSAITRIGVTEEAIADGIIITFYQNTEPEGKHIGDLWYVTGELQGYIEGKIYRYNGTNWTILDDPAIQEAFDEANEARLVADGKIQSFYSNESPTQNIGVGDLWIDLDDSNKLYRYNGTNWVPVYDTRIGETQTQLQTVTQRTTTLETDLGLIEGRVQQTEETLADDVYTKNETETRLTQTANSITSSVSDTYITKIDSASNINTAKTEAINSANTSTDNKLADYYTKTEANSKINQKADEITSTISQTYITKSDSTTNINTAKTEAINSANSSTDNKLLNYSTTTQMNSAILQKANEINLSVSQNYATKIEMGGKYDKEDFTSANIILAINSGVSSANISADKIDIIGKAVKFITHAIEEHVYTQTDVQKITAYILGTGTLTDAEKELYDLDGSTELNIFDIQRINNLINNNNGVNEGTFEIDPFNPKKCLRITDYNGKVVATLGNIGGFLKRLKSNDIETKNLKIDGKNIFDSIYPVGSIYMSVNNVNPETLFGGTWEAWGSGKVPVGVDTNDTDFNTVEKTGGAKTHTLTTSQIPSHTHEGVYRYGGNLNIGGAPASLGEGITVATLTEGQGGIITSATSGSGQSHNNIQPYITCYMWKRIA